MKHIKLYVVIIGFLTAFAACTENPKNDDPTSTITPGNKLKVDSSTAHANNSTDSLKPELNPNKHADVKSQPTTQSANTPKHGSDSTKNK